ncbi:PaaI family thioesterase [Vineibacter terrae]|uniref:PaaI family thioesterase n=2 Tax=Vineibacter terrae TaxID=2586908 RepID=A0A5C8PIL9_9HYPH|nr:PaaI family thioesterase [Vineibacter terrae]
MQGLLGTLLGLKVVEARKDKVVAEFDWRPDLCTVGGTLHGGALMAVADQVGATAAFLNLPAGAGTTTLESKTNFFAGCKAGKVRAEATPLHVGGRTSVWQTRLYDEAGKLLSQTLQTQLVLLPKQG